MAGDAERGADRRSLYTKSLIKSSLLELLKTHSFTSISITALSEHAGIGRNTFYRHYNNLFDTLEDVINDALDEMFSVFRHFDIGQTGNLSSYLVPILEYLHGSDRFRAIFNDEALSDLITSCFINRSDRAFSRYLEQTLLLSRKQADAIVRFQIAGLLEVSRTYARASDDDWVSIIEAFSARFNA